MQYIKINLLFLYILKLILVIVFSQGTGLKEKDDSHPLTVVFCRHNSCIFGTCTRNSQGEDICQCSEGWYGKICNTVACKSPTVYRTTVRESCPPTCYKPFPNCLKQEVPGCKCIDVLGGQILFKGKCVKKCRIKKKRSCKIRPCLHGICIPKKKRKWSCQCNEGWTGKICNVPDCPAPLVRTECAQPICPLTCQNPVINCLVSCKPGCKCPEDKPVYLDGKCITIEECPKT